MSELADLRATWTRAVAGDPGAFAAFYLRHSDAVYRHCRSRVTLQVDAEDLALDVFEIAWRKRAALHFDEDADILLSLLTIANLLLKRHRTATFRRGLLSRRLGLPGRVSDPADEVVVSISRKDYARQAMAAVSRLRLSDQELIRLCVIEQLSTEQVAAILGAKPGTIRTRLSRALARARLEYRLATGDEQADEGGPAAVMT